MDKTRFKINENIIYKCVMGDYYISAPDFYLHFLEKTSAEIFTYLVSGATIEEVVEIFHKKYSVSKRELNNDVIQFFDQMLNLGLIKAENAILDKNQSARTIKSKEISFGETENFSIYQKAYDNDIPIKVDWHATYSCNLRCKHCYAEERIDNCEKFQGLDMDEIKAVFDQLDEAGTFFLRITGGEPFAHPHFMDILSYAREKSFALSIVTNGTLIDEPIAEHLKNIVLQELTFSIHGAKDETHDNFVGKVGAFKKFKENLSLCKSKGLPLKIAWVITEDSKNELDDMIELCREYNVPLSVSPRIMPQIDGKLEPKKYRLSNQSLIEFIKRTNYKADPVNCTVGSKVQINYDGTVQPCLFVSDRIGNLKHESFKDIWVNLQNMREKYQKFREIPQVCKTCEYAKNCHRCPGTALIENNDPKTCPETALWEAKGCYLANL